MHYSLIINCCKYIISNLKGVKNMDNVFEKELNASKVILGSYR